MLSITTKHERTSYRKQAPKHDTFTTWQLKPSIQPIIEHQTTPAVLFIVTSNHNNF